VVNWNDSHLRGTHITVARLRYGWPQSLGFESLQTQLFFCCTASRPYLGPIQSSGRSRALSIIQAVSGAHPSSRTYLGLIQSPGRIWGSFSPQAVSAAYSASWPYLGPMQSPGRSRGSFSLQTVSGAYTASRSYLGLIQPPGCMWGPFVLLFNVYPEIYFSGVKGLRYEAEKSCQFSAKFKNTWSFISAPPCVIIASCLIRHRDRRTLSLM